MEMLDPFFLYVHSFWGRVSILDLAEPIDIHQIVCFDTTSFIHSFIHCIWSLTTCTANHLYSTPPFNPPLSISPALASKQSPFRNRSPQSSPFPIHITIQSSPHEHLRRSCPFSQLLLLTIQTHEATAPAVSARVIPVKASPNSQPCWTVLPHSIRRLVGGMFEV